MAADGLTRRSLFRGGAGVAAGGMLGGAALGGLGGLAAPAEAAVQYPSLPEPPFKEADYWAFADYLQPYFDPLFDETLQAYTNDSRVSGGMLIVHAIAALHGHQGASRNDEVARQLAARLCELPPYRTLKKGQSPGGANPRSESQAHRPGFVGVMNDDDGQQHISIDPKIAEGLYFAWKARNQLGLPSSTVSAIVDRIDKTARGRFFRYPNIRLNQFNFPTELYVYAAAVTGRKDLLDNDYRRQLSRFLRGARKQTSPWAIPNLSPSYSFHRDPFAPVTNPQNVESNEYACIVLENLMRYEDAQRAGMKPLAGVQQQTLRAWARRALPAYWTHAGYLNWDTGLYLLRWHLARYWAWSAGGLLGLSVSSLLPAEERAWAKYMFDQSLQLFVRLAQQAGPEQFVPESPLFGVKTTFSVSLVDFAIRFQWHAARAVDLGLGGAPAIRPPALYAFDPQIGRLAITTPTYNTAVIAVNNKAFPYGGIELARLFDSEQRVVSNIGGKPPAGFGIVVTNSSSKTVVASQTPRARPQPKRAPLRLAKSPRGAVSEGARYPAEPYAGAFTEIESTGKVTRQGVSVRTTHNFTSDRIKINWTVTRSGGGPMSVDALFPSWGSGAALFAILESGESRLLTAGQPVALENVTYFYIAGAETGYVVVPLSLVAGSLASVRSVAPQSSNPQPGPSLSIQLEDVSQWKKVQLTVAIAPAASGAQAAQVAASLRP